MNWRLLFQIVALICFFGKVAAALLPPVLAQFDLIALGLGLWLLSTMVSGRSA